MQKKRSGVDGDGEASTTQLNQKSSESNLDSHVRYNRRDKCTALLEKHSGKYAYK